PEQELEPTAEVVDVESASDAAGESAVETTATPEPEVSPEPVTPVKASTKKPNKFLVDLAKAMQGAAEEARGRAMTQLQADAKTHIETIHGRSATDAANLRRNADDDVAAIRDWSKAEIARIREETEHRITDRKGRLEVEIEEAGAVIEREVEAVQSAVAAFETEMDAFFQRLVGEEDPTRFAAMAESIPEPPTFEDLSSVVAELAAAREAARADADATVASGDDSAEPEAAAETAASADAATEPSESDATTTTLDAEETVGSDDSSGDVVADAGDQTEAGTVDGDVPFTAIADARRSNGKVDHEAAFAAIQAAADAAEATETDSVAASELIGTDDRASTHEQDPRLAALGITPDFEAAEAEALADADSADAEEIPVIEDEALAARIAGLVPATEENVAPETASTQVVVVGLVSVASIASFKRHLGRLAGVQSVGVSSGPEGEFIFAVTHEPNAVLRDAIPSLPTFQARVANVSDGVINVTAHDPEADA
ncbi:MAG TPA: hypothetical protein VGO64_11255, partial [Candidatus Limnocylindrales bacterium]|nr:hypothetical protein [Candidatus Limnocylindrales bacterium]